MKPKNLQRHSPAALLRSFFSPQDMTDGPVMASLIRFSLPLLIGNIFQQLYSTADSIIVGRYVGDNALGAVGATFPITNFLLVLFTAVSGGAGILISQYFGAKDKEKLNRTIGNALTLIFIVSLLLMLLAIPLSRPILELLGTPPELIDMSASYLQITFAGIMGFGFYNMITGILRGMGDSFMPLVFLVITTVLNIALDIYFVAGLGRGVSGVAFATIISQAVSAILCLIHLIKINKAVEITPRNLVPDGALIKNLLKIGLPMGMTQAIFSLAMVTVQALINSMGPTVITTNTAVIRIDGFAMMPNFTFGMAIATFVGQNVGAKRMDRVEAGTKAGFRLAVSVSSFLVLMLLLFGGQVLRLFTSTEAVIALGLQQMRILALGYVALGIAQVFGGVMRGAGDTMPSMWISLFATIGLRVPLAYLLAYLTRSETWPKGAPHAIFASVLIAWITNMVLTYTWFRKGKWREKHIIDSEALEVYEAVADSPEKETA